MSNMYQQTTPELKTVPFKLSLHNNVLSGLLKQNGCGQNGTSRSGVGPHGQQCKNPYSKVVMYWIISLDLLSAFLSRLYNTSKSIR